MDTLATRKEEPSSNSNSNHNNKKVLANNTNNFKGNIFAAAKNTTKPTTTRPTTATATATATATKTTTKTKTTTIATLKKQRNKLIRSPELLNRSDGIRPEVKELSAVTTTTLTQTSTTTNTRAAAAGTSAGTTTIPTKRAKDVMGGGFASPPTRQMHEQLQQQIEEKLTKIGNTESSSKSESGVLKEERKQLTSEQLEVSRKSPTIQREKDKEKPRDKGKDKIGEKTQKAHKESKFAAKLRRSFRRAEHKSLEIKRLESEATDQSQGPHSPQDTRDFSPKPLQRQASGERPSIFALANLPGLGGYINPALLLDSPDEATPPEFNYQHLSSVATTNSNTSIESNDLANDCHTNSSLSSISYAGLQQSNPSMGGELSTSSAAAPTSVSGFMATTSNADGRQRPKLRKQSSSHSDGGFVSLVASAATATHPTSSRSCSTTSESSSAKLTRLQNFLFKSSGDSSRSYLGHSNDGFTASSHNSSSGEWENLANLGSFSEPQAPPATMTETAASSAVAGYDGNGGNYYQYTLTSPTNPFLPEITARTYRSSYDEQEEDEQHAVELEELDSNVTSVKYVTHLHGSSMHQSSPACSLAGSQKEQQESAASTPGRQKRKLFQLYSPQTNFQQQLPQMVASSSSTKSATTTLGSRSLNPFLCDSKTPPTATQAADINSERSSSAADSTASKRLPLRHTSALSSPIAVPQDLNARREEFLRATMKICLVVSPPSSKLQLKSKSLTHLDGLDSMVACQHGPATKPALSKLKLPQSHTAPQPFPQVSHSQSHQFTHHPLRFSSPLSTRPLSTRTPSTRRSLTQSRFSPQAPSPSTTPAIAAASNTTSSSNNRTRCRSPLVGGIGISSAPSLTTHPLHPLSLQNNLESPSTSSAVNVQQMLSPIGGIIAATPSSYRKKSAYMQRKKPLLTRSEVSSSEFFSVSFCTENGCQEEEFIPASKGVALATALSQVLQRRNLSFSQITVIDNNSHELLETGTASLANSLDENTDVEHLAGHHLIISERDGSRKTLQKAASFGSRTRPPRLLSSASTEETTESSDQRIVPGKQLKQRWSGLFGIRNPHQSQLCELLNNYAKMGVPQKSAALNFDHPDFDAAQEYLDSVHKSWKDFVHCDEMSDSETKIQTAIWELVTTEVYYIHALQTVTDLFLACLEAVQEEKLLTDVDQQRLFSNVRDICEANLKFWTLYLYPMVANSVATREPLRVEFFQPGFSNFAAIFAPYKKYCAEQSTCQFYCKELNRTNALFTSYLAWCESQKMCNRLRLADILVRPMQRLTKYSLLLAAIKKHMTDEENMETVDTMMHTVENFVCSVNNHLTTRQETERLKGVMARIECYDVVDTNNEMLDKMVKQHSQMFDLCAPMKGCATHQVRHLFMEGDHKFKDHLGKADVHCFLLTDMLLVCKTIAKKGLGALKVIRQPYLTDRLMVHHSSNTNILNCVYLNEFHVAVTAFTLQCSEAKNWYESLKRTKMIYTRLKQGGNNWDGFRFGVGGISSGTADCLSVKKSPMNSSICSHVTSTNNSHSGSVEWNDSRNISVDFDKTNSLSSDEGSSLLGTSHAFPLKIKNMATTPQKLHVITSSANTLSVQPLNMLGQSLPNLNLHQNQSNLYHTYSNNTLLVPGTTSSHSGNLLLSPSHRGISYPPPSPTRVPLRRGMAFSASIKNPPLLKTRNITSQNSINWHQIPATPTPTSPQAAQNTSAGYASAVVGAAGVGPVSPTADGGNTFVADPLTTSVMQQSGSTLVASNETDV